MKDTLQILFGLLGGLAIFIFGMNMMSECLQKAAGEKMKSILALLTKNPAMGVLAGALTTAVLQSSSATTVMAIGFVSARLMDLPQAISIILGANIGTTITAQIIAFQISDYIYPIIFGGFAVSFAAKAEKVKNIGQTVFAFGLLFLGIETMGDVMKPLASSAFFIDMIAQVGHIPILGVLAGTFMTLIVQSSSATIAVLQNFASQAGADGVTSMLGLSGAIPILLGDNIGTTITAYFASIGQTKDAKRTALAHCIFNISGCFLFLWLLRPFASFVAYISPAGPQTAVISRQIANAHTAFNIIMTLLWTPFLPYLVRIVQAIIPNDTIPAKQSDKQAYLDAKLLMQPAAALHLAETEVFRCGELAGGLLHKLSKAVRQNDSQKNSIFRKKSDDLRVLADQITDYLSDLFSAGSMAEEQSQEASLLMYFIANINRVVFYSREILESLAAQTKKLKFSKDAKKELEKSILFLEEMYRDSLLVAKGERNKAGKVVKRKEEIFDLNVRLQKAHMARIAKGKCIEKLHKPYHRILYTLERMSNSCVNLADAALKRRERHM